LSSNFADYLNFLPYAYASIDNIRMEIDQIEMNPPVLAAANSKFGRPCVDYRDKFLKLEAKCKEAGLDIAGEGFKKQMIKLMNVGEFESVVAEKEREIK
jgi:hypothetical protein